MGTLTEFDEDRAAAARTAGHPLDRMSVPGMLTGLAGPTWLGHVTGERLSLVDLGSGVRRTIDVETVADLLGLAARGDEDGHSALVLADQAQVFALRSALDKVALGRGPRAARAASVSRQVQVAASLPVAGRILSLTGALARRYYVPAPYDGADLTGWARAFGVSGSRLAVMRALVPKAASGRSRPVFEWLLGAERQALLSAGYGAGPASATGAFRAVQSLSDRWRALCLEDPTLRERNLVSGDVCRVQVDHHGAASFTGAVSTPVRFKEGATLAATTRDGATFDTMLVSLDVAGRELHGTFRSPAPRARAYEAFRRAVEGPGPVYMHERPFTTRAAASTGSWLARSLPAAVEGRDVPVDVVLAGAPSAA